VRSFGAEICGDNGRCVWEDRRVDNQTRTLELVEAIDAGRISYELPDALDALGRVRELVRELDRELALLQRYFAART
jgi:hypothetical protein